MKDYFYGVTQKLAQPLSTKSRAVSVVAALILPISFLTPLWHMTFMAQQYPEGLDLYIYSHALIGGDDGNDLTEINVLNHYIGMKELVPEDFNELKWIPLIVGGLVLLTLRAAVIGTLGSLIDVFVMSIYFGLFSLWSFWYKMNLYGRELDPTAAVTVDPFMPPIFGYELVGQFHVWSYPAAGSYVMAAFGLLLVAAMYLSWKRTTDSQEVP